MPPRPQPPLQLRPRDLDGLVTWTLIRAGRQWEQILTDRLAPHGLTPVQFGVLAQLAAEPLLTQSELARRVLMRPQSMHHLLDTMIDRDLVQRTGGRGSGRANPIRTTAAGDELLRAVWPVVQQANGPHDLDLPLDRIRALNRTLHELLDRAAGAAT